jgi:putative phosphoesterase
MKIGLISDTHGYFDPRLPKVFAGVDHILHAGDIGPMDILHELEGIAPVTAVLGNNDYLLSLPLTQVLELDQCKFLVHHIVTPGEPYSPISQRIAQEQPQVVVFGHTHKASETQHGSILYVNPGYAGKPKASAKRSVALLHLGDELRVEFVPLPEGG